MPRVHLIKTNFTGGEFSPLLEGRVDIDQYANAVSELKNFLIMPHGGVVRRGGWHYVDDTKDHTKKSRIIPFQYSSVQAYICEFGDLYIRFYMDGYLIKVVTGATLITNGTFDADITGWTDKSIAPGTIAWDTDHMVLNGGATGTGWAQQAITTVVGKEYCLVFDVAANALKARVGSTDGGQEILSDTVVPVGTNRTIIFTAESIATYIGFRRDSNGGANLDNVVCKEWIPYEKVSPYSEDDLDEIKFAQSANNLYLVHPLVPPQILTRSAHDNWSINDMNFIDGPYYDQPTNPTPPSITPSGTTGSITLDASAAVFDVEGHVGALWRLYEGTTWGYVELVEDASNSTIHFHATVISTLGGVAATTVWREGSWCPLSGYPTSICFHEDRAVLAGTDGQPQTFWGSKSGAYNDFTPGADASSAYYYTLGSGKVDIILWLASAKSLLIGTQGAEYVAKGGSDSAITPSNIDVKSEGTYGSSILQPIRIGNCVLFVQTAGRKMRELAYDWQSDAYHAPDLTLLAEHLTYIGIKDVAYQQEPYSIVWVITNNDLLLSLTYERTQKIVGWAQHPTEGTVESIAVISNPTILEDELWGVVNRTVGGVPKRFIERLSFDNYTDCCLNYDEPTPVNQVWGMDHLIGKTVDVVGDGAVYPQAVIATDGSVTLDGSVASGIEVGLHFESRILSLRPEVTTGAGTTQGIAKHWSKLGVRLFETIGITINGKLVEFRIPDDPMDEGVDLFSGDKWMTNIGRDRDAKVSIEQTQPLPCTVVCLMGVLDFGD